MATGCVILCNECGTTIRLVDGSLPAQGKAMERHAEREPKAHPLTLRVFETLRREANDGKR